MHTHNTHPHHAPWTNFMQTQPCKLCKKKKQKPTKMELTASLHQISHPSCKTTLCKLCHLAMQALLKPTPLTKQTHANSRWDRTQIYSSCKVKLMLKKARTEPCQDTNDPCKHLWLDKFKTMQGYSSCLPCKVKLKDHSSCTFGRANFKTIQGHSSCKQGHAKYKTKTRQMKTKPYTYSHAKTHG